MNGRLARPGKSPGAWERTPAYLDVNLKPGARPWKPTAVYRSGGKAGQGVGFQKPATGGELDFYAARSYSVISPPRMGRRLIRWWVGSAGGRSDRGGCIASARSATGAWWRPTARSRAADCRAAEAEQRLRRWSEFRPEQHRHQGLRAISRSVYGLGKVLVVDGHGAQVGEYHLPDRGP
jgi:hypothetical protein